MAAKQKGLFAHTEGFETIAKGNASHAEGQQTKALNNASHSEGRLTIASGKYSHAQGFRTKAEGKNSTAIGQRIRVVGNNSVGIQMDNIPNRTLTKNQVFAIMGGKVGIETLNPQSTLEVNGSLEVTGSSTICNFEFNSFENFQIIRAQKGKDIVLETTKDLQGNGKLHYVKNGDDYVVMPNEDTEVATIHDVKTNTSIKLHAGDQNFPQQGNFSHLYIDTITNKMYRWNGTSYTQIVS
jgi:hypothetical protein